MSVLENNAIAITKYILMHKRIPVISIEFDNVTDYTQKICDVYNPKHLPIGISIKNGIVDKNTFNTWWMSRSIPASRIGIAKTLKTLEISDTKVLLLKCYGLSLSDQYWIKPENSNLKWEDINFFNNTFSYDIGNVLFGINIENNILNFFSPDNTTDGCLKKRWKIIDGKHCLIKGGSNPFHQQPFNEVIASKIMEKLNIPHVTYSLIWDNNIAYSVCEDFVDENTELVPAWRVLMTQKRNNSTSLHQHFINCCEGLGIYNVSKFLDYMITIDYIIANEDRHLNNFGLLRNVETLEWIGIAPIYDSGSSLGFDKLPSQMKSEKDIECKPFKNDFLEQLRLVQSFDWLDLSKLDNIESIIRNIFAKDINKTYIDDNRIDAIVNSIKRRLYNLEQIVKRRNNKY